MPAKGRPYVKEANPFWFWMTAALYGAALAGYFWLVAFFIVDATSR